MLHHDVLFHYGVKGMKWRKKKLGNEERDIEVESDRRINEVLGYGVLGAAYANAFGALSDSDYRNTIRDVYNATMKTAETYYKKSNGSNVRLKRLSTKFSDRQLETVHKENASKLFQEYAKEAKRDPKYTRMHVKGKKRDLL